MIEVFKPFQTTLEAAKENFANLVKYKLYLFIHNVAIFVKTDSDDLEYIRHNEYAVAFRFNGQIFTVGYISRTENGKKIDDPKGEFKKFVDFLRGLMNDYPHQIILGDFNLHHDFNDGKIVGSHAQNSGWNELQHTMFSTLFVKNRFVQKNPFPNAKGNYLDVLYSNMSGLSVACTKIIGEMGIMEKKRELYHDRLNYKLTWD